MRSGVFLAKAKALLILGFIICGSLIISNVEGAMGGGPNYKAEIKAKFKNVDISDGVNKNEAIIIAQNFLIDNKFDIKDIRISKYTIEDKPINQKLWVISFDATDKTRKESGLEWYTIQIDKDTGEIKGHGWGPS